MSDDRPPPDASGTGAPAPEAAPGLPPVPGPEAEPVPGSGGAPAGAAERDEESDGDRAPDIAVLVLDVLAQGPATAFEIVGRLDEREPGLLGPREGYLYPLLFEMRRAGRVEARWVDRPDGRRRVYALAGSEWPVTWPANGLDTSGLTPTRAIRRIAEAATDRVTFAPTLAEETRAEILRHVLDGAATRERSGESPEDAERQAIRALGDPWKISTDLARVAGGRRTVIFARTARESALSLAIYDLGILVAILATIAFVRIEVVAAYHIPTKSMEPTLHGDRDGGDRILVLRTTPPPSRFDIEVFEGWGTERKQYVKRCVALPGEDVRLFEGDLWIDGRLVRKEGSALDAMLFPMFDVGVEAAAAARDKTRLRDRFQDRWAFDGGTSWSQWPQGDFEVVVDAPAGGADAADPAVLRWRGRLTDGLYDAETGELDDGITDVADGRIAVDITPKDETAQVLVRWERGAERYDAVLRGEQPGVAIFVNGIEVERAAAATVPVGRTTRVRFSEVDRVLRLEIDGALVLRHDLDAPADPKRTGPGADVSVRVPRGSVRIRPIRLERDVHWTSEYESLDRERLGPDEYFMLGDNSSNSQDSRYKGPVHRSRLVGSPLLIVWPLSRFRIPR